MPLLADAVLIVHLLFVLFVVGGLFAVWIGAPFGWGWVRNRRFRIAHLAAILFVAAQSLAGLVCPLTVLEDMLRGRHAVEAGFIQRWVERLIYYDLPGWVFTIAYVSFALIVLATFFLIRPAARKPGDAPSASSRAGGSG